MANACPKISFQRATAWTMAIAVVLYGLAITSTKIIASAGSPLDKLPGLAGFVAAAGALVAAVIIEMKYSGVSPGKAFVALGFKPGNRLQVFPTIVGVTSIFLGYVFISIFLRKSTELVPGFLFFSLKLLVSQGLIEEAVFRGLIFRHLRKGRSFWKAAALSGSLFALTHVVNLAKGSSPEILAEDARALGRIHRGAGWFLRDCHFGLQARFT